MAPPRPIVDLAMCFAFAGAGWVTPGDGRDV
jgi:hypothetical protein